MATKKAKVDLSQYEVEGVREDGSLIMRPKAPPKPVTPAAGAPSDLTASLAAVHAKLDALDAKVSRLETIEAHVADLVLGRRGRSGPPPAPRAATTGEYSK